MKSDHTPSVLIGTFQASPHFLKDFNDLLKGIKVWHVSQMNLTFSFFFCKVPETFVSVSLNKSKKGQRLVSALKLKRNHQNTIAGAHLLQACWRPFEDHHEAFGGWSQKRRSLPTSLCATRLNTTPAPLVTDSFSGKLNSH